VRLLVWRGTDAFRTEVVAAELSTDGLRARGTQVGVDPLPYRLDYELETGSDFVTTRLDARVEGGDWSRSLELTRDAGGWRLEAGSDGAVELPPPGGERSGLEEALDCDIAFSPLTNTMPVLRAGLLDSPGRREIVAAWMAVPELTVQPARQGYEHVRGITRGAIVRYRSLDGDFVSELEFDRDGFVRRYPQMAERVG
jgi:hypothetical protein